MTEKEAIKILLGNKYHNGWTILLFGTIISINSTVVHASPDAARVALIRYLAMHPILRKQLARQLFSNQKYPSILSEDKPTQKEREERDRRHDDAEKNVASLIDKQIITIVKI